MELRRDPFHAIADPTRRQIIGMLAQKPQNLNSLAEQFDMSRQAISLHVKILNECGIITINQIGRERICHAKLEKLEEVSAWVSQYKEFWTERFASLEKHLETIKSKSK